MPPAVRWEIVGGSDKGGILVREDASTKSAELGRSLAVLRKPTGTLKWMVYKGKFHQKWTDLGVPLFQETPNW